MAQESQKKTKARQLPLNIGPLYFMKTIPINILEMAHEQLSSQFQHIRSERVTELSLSYGNFEKHIRKIDDYRDWVEKYQLVRLVTLNCAHNPFINIKQLTGLRFNNLENLILSDCQIESIQNLCRCDFPNLSCLTLYNNNLTNINHSLRKLNNPFLMQLTIDNNLIIELDGCMTEGWMTYLQKLQINNNKICEVGVLLKCNYSKLHEQRLQSPEYIIQQHWKNTLEQKLCAKFTML